MRTKGKVSIVGTNVMDSGGHIVANCGGYTSNQPDWEDILRRNIDNTAFIAMCYNTAAALDEVGYDGEAAIRELPELVETLVRINKGCAKPVNDMELAVRDVTQAALDLIRGDK